LPPTLRDRSIVIPLVAAPEGKLPVPFDPLDIKAETLLARKIARWVKDNFAALAACKPDLPPSAFNRLADNWRPLLAIAQIAGGHWPDLARNAFNQLTAKPKSQDLVLALLSDLRQIFSKSGSPRLFSSALVDSLCALPNHIWQKTNQGGKPINENWLRRQLDTFGVAPRRMLIGNRRAQGYHFEHIAKALS